MEYLWETCGIMWDICGITFCFVQPPNYGMLLIFKDCVQGVLEIFSRQLLEINREWCQFIAVSADRISLPLMVLSTTSVLLIMISR